MRAQRFIEGQRLFSTDDILAESQPADCAGHGGCGVVEWHARRVRANGDVHTGVQPLARHHKARHSFHAENVFISVTPDEDKVRIGAGDDAQVAQARRGLRRGEHSVFQPVARVGTWVGIHGAFIRIDSQVGCRVADAVGADLQAGIVQGFHHGFIFLRIPGGHVPARAAVGLVAEGGWRLPVNQEFVAGDARETILVEFKLPHLIHIRKPFNGQVQRRTQG